MYGNSAGDGGSDVQLYPAGLDGPLGCKPAESPLMGI